MTVKGYRKMKLSDLDRITRGIIKSIEDNIHEGDNRRDGRRVPSKVERVLGPSQSHDPPGERSKRPDC